jgi:4-hydroxybenzoate polyprenyltransferase
MFALQAAIGALNDVVDAPLDAGRKPGKPIPRGLVSLPTARLVAIAGAAVGISLSLPSGPAATLVALLILVVGGLYDLRFKGTPWSWLPFAVGIPLLPVYAWLGAAGALPPAFAVLLPAAGLAGAGLAIANSLPDQERDRAGGSSSVADSLGRGAAWRLHALLHAGVLTVALGGLVWLGPAEPPLPAVAGMAIGGLLLGAGLALTASSSPIRRERGWELEAVGIGLLGTSWVAAVVLTRA